ncbi:MAG: adenylate/guanylate cyclase domain-containing protein [Geminicoccaceae bacterium]
MTEQLNNSGAKPLRRMSISAYLGIGLGGLVSVALAVLLFVTLSTVFKNTTELLNDKSRLLLGALTSQTSQYLDATLAPCNVVADAIGSGRIDPHDDGQMMPLLQTLLATTPQVAAMAFFDVDGTRVAAFHVDDRIMSDRQPWPEQADIEGALSAIKSSRSAFWGPPVYDDALGTFLNLNVPAFEGEVFRGMVTAIVTIQALSEFLGGLDTEIGQNTFILYDRDYVLAHLALIQSFEGLSDEQPLPKVTEVGDPVLFTIWREGWQEQALVAGRGHAGKAFDEEYVFLYAPLDDYADAPWLVGSYFSIDTVGAQFQRMIAAATASFLIVILVAIATYLFGRFLRRPINRLAEAASAVRDLDLDSVPKLQRSHFAELDDAGQAFNAMVAALRAFSLYVPRDLVRRLIARGDVASLSSEAREITVMLTDIAGFTSRAEQMSAAETAAFLNEHLSLVTACIEAEGGIGDKFMGDAVMALWGAIEYEPDHAIRAVKAAARIRDAVHQDNLDRADPVIVRIGIHSGAVVAGNIGSTTRMDYTVVGDTVNIAQRLEVLGKSLLPDSEVAILLSAETVKALPAMIDVSSLGQTTLRGRALPSEIFTLSNPSSPIPGAKNAATEATVLIQSTKP